MAETVTRFSDAIQKWKKHKAEKKFDGEQLVRMGGILMTTIQSMEASCFINIELCTIFLQKGANFCLLQTELAENAKKKKKKLNDPSDSCMMYENFEIENSFQKMYSSLVISCIGALT